MSRASATTRNYAKSSPLSDYFRLGGHSPRTSHDVPQSRISAHCYHPPMASQIQKKITEVFPALAEELSTIPANEGSDSRWMTELGSRTVAWFDAGRIEEVRSAFGLTELLIESGSEGERRAAIVGFLETVQNVGSHREHGAAVFEQFLGPISRTAWAELNQLWKGKTSLAEVIAAETGARLTPRWWQFWRKRERRSPTELLDAVQDPELRKIIERMTRE